MKKIIVVAGATGNLGGQITAALLKRGAEVRVIVRPTSDVEKVNHLRKQGAVVSVVDAWNVEEIGKVCVGASCVVSALAGLREVIIDAQKVLLDAAVAAGVPRFIPSDYSLDFTKIPDGSNRNLDLRRAFHTILDKAPIAATSIFNGAFADMLTGQMPMIIFNIKRVIYWGNADQRMDFTTENDTALFTANVALDSNTPRYLRIAGDQISPREMKMVMREITGETYHLLRPGGLGLLGFMIKVGRFFAPSKKELYPAWQGMQYMHNMSDGRALMQQLDNKRYSDRLLTTTRDVLTKHFEG